MLLFSKSLFLYFGTLIILFTFNYNFYGVLGIINSFISNKYLRPELNIFYSFIFVFTLTCFLNLGLLKVISFVFRFDCDDFRTQANMLTSKFNKYLFPTFLAYYFVTNIIANYPKTFTNPIHYSYFIDTLRVLLFLLFQFVISCNIAFIISYFPIKFIRFSLITIVTFVLYLSYKP